MRKKLSIIILFVIGLFFVLTAPSFAKEMTAQEIGEEIENEHPFAIYAYIIGKHVYIPDATHKLDTQDIMLAARSIEIENEDTATKEDLYNKMIIHELDKEDDGWQFVEDYVGNTILQPTDKLDICYINYDIIPEDTNITISLDNVNELLEKSKETLKYEKNSEDLKLEGTGKELKLTGTIEKNVTVDETVFPTEQLTGHYFAYTLQVEGKVTDATTVKLTNGDEQAKILTGTSAFDDVENGIMLVLTHLNQSATNKTLKIEVDLDGEGTLYNATEYIIDYSDVTFEDTIVYNQVELENAINNPSITTILIAQNIEIDKTLEISLDNTRTLTIKSLKDDQINTICYTKPTTEGEADNTPAIKVTKGDVTFENVKIQNATRAISVLSGAKVIATNVEAIDSQDTAFDVAQGATFIGTDIKYTTADGKDKESYSYPTICGYGTVTLYKTEDGVKKEINATVVSNYERIVRSPDRAWEEKDFLDPETGEKPDTFFDEDGKLKPLYQELIGTHRKNHSDYITKTNHKHYYLKEENSKYKVYYFRDSQLNLILIYHFGGGEQIIAPVTNAYQNADEHMHFFKKAYTKDNKTYVFDGWSTVRGGSDGKPYGVDTQKVELTLATNNYYSRYVEGFMVEIPMTGKVKQDDGTIQDEEVTGRFGIVKPTNEETVTIQDLINQDKEFADAFHALQEKATQEGKVIVNKNDTTKEVTEDTIISNNMKLEVGNITLTLSIDGLKTSENSISGIINTKSENGKYYIPVTIASEHFQNEVSTVTVTDPNNNTEVYTYSENAEDGIATVSNEKTMNLQLEAIKTSNITSGNKVYQIAVDVDGENSDEYTIQNYTIDYNHVRTLEEIINNAAENTQKVNNLTLQRNNYIKDNKQICTVQYDRETGRRYYTEGKVIQYTFAESEVNENAAKSKICVQKVNTQTEEGKVYLNNWEYCNSFSKVGDGVLELELLRDIVGKNGTIGAIIGVNKKEKDHTYEVIISNKKIGDWLNRNYIDFATGETKEGENTFQFEDLLPVILEVTLDSNDQYVTGIKTLNSFSITKKSETTQIYRDNKIDVTITDIGTTTIKAPQEMLGEDEKNPATNEQIQNFIKEGREWWSKHTGSERYQ